MEFTWSIRRSTRTAMCISRWAPPIFPHDVRLIKKIVQKSRRFVARLTQNIFSTSGSGGTPSAISIKGFFSGGTRKWKKVLAKTRSKANYGEIQGPPWLTVTMCWLIRVGLLRKWTQSVFRNRSSQTNKWDRKKSINMACWEDVENRKKLCGWEKASEMQFIDAYVRSDIFFPVPTIYHYHKADPKQKAKYAFRLLCDAFL